jgi:hypothetical protein
MVANIIIAAIDQFDLEDLHSLNFYKCDAWVDIHRTIDKSKYNNITTLFVSISVMLSLNDNYFKFESLKAASPI